jgi:hypothetical protein
MNLRNHFLSPIEKGRYGAPVSAMAASPGY